MLCDPAKLAELKQIPNLEIQVRPIRTPDPNVVRLAVLADDAAQTAARALGCTVKIVKSAEAYRKQIEDLYPASDPPSKPPQR